MARKVHRKIGLEVDGLDELLDRLNALGGSVEQTVETALIQSKKRVTKEVEAAMDKSPYNYDRTGRTRKSLDKESVVDWEGGVASIGVGFDISNGGLASVFLMYGTHFHGTPRIKPDRGLYRALFGKEIREEVTKIQTEVIAGAITKTGLSHD